MTPNYNKEKEVKVFPAERHLSKNSKLFMNLMKKGRHLVICASQCFQI